MTVLQKKNKPKKLKPQPKHPIKVHILGGISRLGATQVVVFSGTITTTRYYIILEKALLPFIKDVHPCTHKFQPDNDPKHCSKYIKAFPKEKEVVWWKTPLESPDLNPVENTCIWASLKYFLRHQWNPRDLESLIDGIKCFWNSLSLLHYVRATYNTYTKSCQKYLKLMVLLLVIDRVVIIIDKSTFIINFSF